MKKKDIALSGLHIIPFLITQLIIYGNLSECDDKHRKKALLTGTVFNIVVNIISIYFIYYIVFDTLNPWSILKSLIYKECTYQVLGRVATALMISIIVAIFVGILGSILVAKEIPKFTKKMTGMLLLIVTISMIPIIVALNVSNNELSNIVISEVCRDNVDSGNDTDDESSYIVIRNTGSYTCEIDELYLINSEDEEDKLTIQNISLKPCGEYKYSFIQDYGIDIKKKGGSIICLVDGDGNIIDHVTVPSLLEDESYKLTDGKWDIVSIEVPTPIFSVESGFYDEPFELNITADEGMSIYYTLDSSIPTQNSEQYTSPIYVYNKSDEPNQYRSVQNVVPNYLEIGQLGEDAVDKCFVVRAVAVDQSGKTSDVVTKSYFVGMDNYEDKRVISLVADPDDMFGEDGIYVTGAEYDKWYENGASSDVEKPIANFNQHGIEWERKANLEIFDTGEVIDNQAVGIRIQGASAREGSLKRFSIYSRKDYSKSKWFDTALFDGVKTHSVVLRAGNYNAMVQALSAGRSAFNIESKTIVLFLNGEYWYDSFMFEKLSNEYFAEHYGVNEDNVIIASEGRTETEYTDYEESFEYLSTFVENNDMSVDANYEKLNQMMDVQSYIDYWAINIYIAGMDTSEIKNTVAWKTSVKENDEYGDNRWRWVFYDMDSMLSITRLDYDNLETNAQLNSFNIKGKFVTIPIDQGVFWKALTVREDFCKQFVISFMDILNTNFSLSNVETILNEYGYDISYEDYFFRERPKYIVQYMAEEFGLTGTTGKVTLSSNMTGSPIMLNTITPQIVSEDEGWSGNYLTDYPVNVTATQNGFDHWEVTSGGQTSNYTDITIEVPVVEGGVEIYAVYK
jgi:hypothetical protein